MKNELDAVEGAYPVGAMPHIAVHELDVRA
jgi:hypothetical protein